MQKIGSSIEGSVTIASCLAVLYFANPFPPTQFPTTWCPDGDFLVPSIGFSLIFASVAMYRRKWELAAIGTPVLALLCTQLQITLRDWFRWFTFRTDLLVFLVLSICTVAAYVVARPSYSKFGFIAATVAAFSISALAGTLHAMFKPRLVMVEIPAFIAFVLAGPLLGMIIGLPLRNLQRRDSTPIEHKSPD